MSKGGNGFGVRFTNITGDTRDTMAGMSSANDSNLITDRVSGDEQVPFNPLRFSSSQFSESVLGSARETMDEQGSMSQRNKIPNQEYKQSVITHQAEKLQKTEIEGRPESPPKLRKTNKKIVVPSTRNFERK